MLTIYTKLATLKQSLRDEAGATAAEYGLLIALIALVLAAGALLLGEGLDELFTDIADCFGAVDGGDCPVDRFAGGEQTSG